MSSVSSPGPSTRSLAEYAATMEVARLPEEVVERARQVVLDTFGALLSGSLMETGRDFIALSKSLATPSGSTIVGSPLRYGAIDAALINGAVAHASETDDAHFSSLTHPAGMAVPAALAVGENRGVSGADLIAAVVACYDVQCRIAVAMGPRNVQSRSFVTLSVCGSFGSAVAAGRALGLDADRMVAALGLAGLQTGGVWASAEEPRHYAKALVSGFAVRDGVTAALLASEGVPGPEAILEGRNNAVLAFSGNPDYGQLTAELGKRFEIMGTSIKKHACGGPIRGPVDGLLELRQKHHLAGGEIEAMEIRMAHSALQLVGDRADPAMSLGFVVAVAAFDGRVGIEQTHSPSRTRDPKVLALAKRVTARGDDEMEAAWPAFRPAELTLTLRDGRSLFIRVDHAVGSPERPMSRHEVEEKFLRLSTPVLGEARARDLVGLVWRLESVGDVRELTEYLS